MIVFLVLDDSLQAIDVNMARTNFDPTATCWKLKWPCHRHLEHRNRISSHYLRMKTLKTKPLLATFILTYRELKSRKRREHPSRPVAGMNAD
jgi:hypothetical protein